MTQIRLAANYWNFDLGPTKSFRVTERMKLQFRADMFNASSQTIIQTGEAARLIQFAPQLQF